MEKNALCSETKCNEKGFKNTLRLHVWKAFITIKFATIDARTSYFKVTKAFPRVVSALPSGFFSL